MVVVVGGGDMVSEVVRGRGVAGTRPGGVFSHCVPSPRPSDPQRSRREACQLALKPCPPML